jgi:hypothetical protein
VAEVSTDWTEKYGTSDRIRGLDHLSLESTAENIYDQVTPGFTNLARRARYYALYCWILYDYFSGGYGREEFRPFFRRREQAYALACLSHNHKARAVGEYSIMGSIRAKMNWNSGDDPIDVSKSHMDSPLGGYGLYYRNAMQRAGLIYLDEGQARLTESSSGGPSGRALAEAFQRTIEDTAYVQRYRDQYNVPRSVLEEYGRAACVCGMADSEDGEVLRRALLQFDPPEPEPAVRRMHLSRAKTLTLTFDAIRNCGNERMDDGAWRRLMFYGTYADGRGYEIPEQLVDNARTWRMYQQREYHVYALTSMWVALLAWLEQLRVATLEEWVDEIDSMVDLKRTGARFGLDLVRGIPSEITLQEMLDSIAAAAEVAESFDPDISEDIARGIGRDAPCSESSIHRALDGGAEMDLADFAGSALWLSLVLVARTYDWMAEDALLAALARTGGPQHWSAESYFREVNARREQPVLDFLAWLYQGLVRQHLAVALSKLPLDTFMLLYEEGALHFRAMDWAQFTADRYETMLIACRDLGWVEESKDLYRLTSLGEKALSEAQEGLE